jgi:TatA/E family protein of Tat protein translocase
LKKFAPAEALGAFRLFQSIDGDVEPAAIRVRQGCFIGLFAATALEYDGVRMSLPDTIFIFALALIIFGPKKLPEIGRQIGRLVGEFRRASNEFKYQIEEELRQVELAERDEKESATAALSSESGEEASEDAESVSYDASSELEDALPVGQYPNIDSIDTSEFRSPEETEAAYDGDYEREIAGRAEYDPETWAREDGDHVHTAGEEPDYAGHEETAAVLTDGAVDDPSSATEATPDSSYAGNSDGVVIPFEKPASTRQSSSAAASQANGDGSTRGQPAPAGAEIAHG